MSENAKEARDAQLLFWGCFTSIVATAFGFVIRGQVLGDWGTEFGLDETQKGVIGGVGLWPFAISIVLFSLVIDKIGYGKSMIFAFAAHVASAVILITAKSYDALWWGTFIGALGNGTVEAVANPVVATMFPREKTKYLNILHAGWPGGMVIGGILGMILAGAGWQTKVGLILLPTIVYGVLLLGRKFPVHERVEAGVSYLDMLKEAGFVGAFIVIALMFRELGVSLLQNTFGMDAQTSLYVQIGAIVVVTGAYAAIVKSPGRPMFIFLVLVMIPLATTELGTDSWVTDLMTPVMGSNAGWVLIYTSFIMMVMRFFAGAVVHRISPLGLLAVSAAIAAAGLFALSAATGVMIIVAATLYAFGKTFFWPTTLGVVAEQFPKGGAVTMNLIAGVGMLGVGILGGPFIGSVQDSNIGKSLDKKNPELHAKLAVEKQSVFGAYEAVDAEKLKGATEEEQALVKEISADAKKGALATIAILPIIMLVCYLILIAYFRSKGGYKIVSLGDHSDEAKATGEL